MIRNALISELCKGLLFGVLLFLLLSPTRTEASDTLVQIAAAQVKPHPKVSREIEDSKRKFEQNLAYKTREQLYKEVFGIPPPPLPRQIEASLTVNEKVDGKIEVVFTEDRLDFSIPAAPVISMITEMITPAFIDSVKERIDGSGRLFKSQLDALRLETIFDSQDYLVHITIPPDLLSKQVHDLKGYRDDPYVTESIKPNTTSAYLNAYVDQKLKHIQTISGDTTSSYYKFSKNSNNELRQPIYGNFDGAINIKGVVLEGNGSYREIDKHPLQRKDVRLVYDLPKSFLRFTAGDLTYQTPGYLSYVPIGGIGISKDYSLQPHVMSFPISEREFFLKEPSEVEVWVNDVLVKSMVLEPGTHDIRGFPFASGSNKVRIEIKDFSGRAETLEFSDIYEPTLLSKGISQYTCNAGFPTTMTQNRYSYATNDPFLLLTYKRGLTSNLTIDAYGQSLKSRGILGTEGLYAHALGNLQFALAGSYDRMAGPDFAARLGFFYRSKVSYSKVKGVITTARINPVTWNTEVEYRGSNFPKHLQDTIHYFQAGTQISTDLYIPMPGQFNVGLKSTYNIRPDSIDLFGLSLSFQKTIMRSLRAGASFNYLSNIKFNRANPAISINAQWSFMAGPNSFSVNETVTKQPSPPVDTFGLPSTAKSRSWGFNTDVQWDYIDLNPRPEKINAGIAARVSEDYSEYNGCVGYNGNAGSIEFNQNLAEPGFAQGLFIQHQSDLSLKTALVYVDGTFGFSHPVYDGFMVAKGVKNLKGSTVRINPNDVGYDATSVWYGPAVLPLHSPYQLQKVKIAPINSSVASVSEKMAFTLFPQYKSGFLINVGTDKTVLVIGTLIDKKKNPFGYQSISIVSKGDKTTEPIRTFTNQAGKFQFMGKSGQTYEIRLAGSTTETPIAVFIPKDKNDFYRVGELYVDGNAQQIKTPEGNDSPAESSIPDSRGQGILAQSDSSEPMKYDLAQDEIMGDTVIVDPEDVIDQEFAKNLVDPKAKHAYILGTLKSPKGEVLPFTAFEVSPVDDSSQEPIRSFTNKEGKFQIICAKPTKYRITAPLGQKGDTVLYGTDTFYVTAKSMGSHRQVGKLILSNDSGISKAAPPQMANSILITGTLVEKDGKLIKFTPIAFSSLDKANNTFTDKNGSFRIICNATGRYMISISGSKDGLGSFINIPAGTKGHFDLGQVTMPKVPATQRVK